MVGTRERIVAAAIRCFARDGARNCNMTQIAREARLARVTLYRLFADRAALLRAVADDRFAQIIGEVARFIAPIERLEDAIVRGSGHALALARDDALLLDVLAHGDGESVEAFLIALTPEIRELYARAWRPLFAAARASGELVSTLPDDRLIEGMLAIVSPILLRRDFDGDDERRFIIDFVLPAIFRS